jgi:hypothetical protein
MGFYAVQNQENDCDIEVQLQVTAMLCVSLDLNSSKVIPIVTKTTKIINPNNATERKSESRHSATPVSSEFAPSFSYCRKINAAFLSIKDSN